jgi:hypothetical protein
MTNESAPAWYDVVTCAPADLTPTEIARCLALLDEGKAVSVETARRDLPRSPLIAVVRHAGDIVGLGVNKGARAWYAAKIAEHSAHSFPTDTPEIGYVVVDSNHRDNHLSTRIVAALLENDRGPLFATTDKPRMKAVLQRAGFEQKGSPWGERSQLSLWIRPAKASSPNE